MVEGGITQWLMQQAPVVVVMGLVIWWLARLYLSERAYNKEITEKNIDILKEFIEKENEKTP